MRLTTFCRSSLCVSSLEGLDEHAVLDGLLEHALYLRVAVAHLPCELTHTVHVDAAEQDEDGNDAHDDEGEQVVHREQIVERAEEQGQYRQGVGKGLGEEVDDILHVAFQAVEHVAGMALLLAVPFGAEDTVEHALLHAVLCTDAQDVTYPDG